ncbi:MAG: hypothetical protein SPL86_04385 [Succiniclasticum sp.]|uniref:hypothetical protein n=1 Tax=Succiniclasticum sp. TaxID=2775030 RepID=UPI002A91877A|nr:hypothetical protein [Succiniclasticum sp.]MDY6290705.1 hypothetical protein [Succiniclasticum sp.]
MANNEVFSVRADKETIEKFNAIVEKSGFKKADLLPALIATWEAEEDRNLLPGRADEIDAFDALLKQVRTSYRNSLQLAVLAKDTAIKEVSVSLEAKDRTIVELQKQIDGLNNTIAEKDNAIVSITEENKKLHAEVVQLTESINEKNATIKTLQDNADAVKILELVKDLKHILPLQTKTNNGNVSEPSPN